ncbi:MAG: hypothetical protein RL733_915, partial [Actinomycetota bacterium]
SSALMESPVGLNLSTSTWVDDITVVQSVHCPQPFSLHTKAAAKATAAFDLPDPGGPTNNQEWVMACDPVPLFAAFTA